ncbi:HAD-IIA family hydrolase [Trujillonella endophytica]|uniref:Haloacid Dehalogenase Superfamily Class (Subfamily) IIA/haloacid dehalogenase superfamily, subfamily IA, variant 1 with third motif having Dx(3-4)D or Dx(3-4)E n=1 Tax=Trujillonella endophytica TaxID=673521 RepID=A0A1H8T9K6_9ACTN|nr:HAD-IIA family hydrolase [Trujillella endophytica]SEO87178.1 Haloacid Dehalogenase Superfamily Class (subfamily) IIA/haloacid dehalogenase superfamily, subfamily IA, variant 1 with third motif having Dx(3-4)D or Dx(3-4)E [Trujillella endophytica]
MSLGERVPLSAGCAQAPTAAHDVALLDLDGVVYVGPDAVPGVPEALAAARSAGMRLGFVTNNAARTPEEVAAHLTELGVPAAPDDVITSSQAAATVVAQRWGSGARVLPVGGPGVAAALRAAGLTVVERAEDAPVAVVQGYGREVGWAQLAEAVVAVRSGARHVATNTDATIPSPRGPLPGNGAMVGVVAAVTGQEPLVTGKPDPAMHAECVRRTGARTPLVVGDRLDTDIEGARRAGAASLLVLTGVTGPAELLAADPGRRPDLLAHDCAGLLTPHPQVLAEGQGWRCGAWWARSGSGGLVLGHAAEGTPPGGEASGDGLDGLRALCVAAWAAAPGHASAPSVEAADEEARRVLQEWGLAAGRHP